MQSLRSTIARSLSAALSGGGLALLYFALFAAAALLMVPGCTNRTSAPVVLGYLGDLSDRTSDLGREGRDGALLAVERFNEAGGVDGRTVRLMVQDDAQDSTAAVAGVRALYDRGAIAVIGPMTSDIAVAIVPVADELGLPIVSPTVSTDLLTGKDDMFFRVYPDNRSAATKLASVMVQRLHLPTTAVIYDLRNRAHTETWAGHFSVEYGRLGGTVKVSKTFESGTVQGYRDDAEQASDSESDSIFLLANALDTALLATLVRRDGFKGTIVASEWSATENVIGYGGSAVEGMVFLNTINRDSTDTTYGDFRSAFRGRFGYEPGFASVHAYEAAQLVLSRMGEEPSRDGLARALRTGGSVDSVQGRLKLDDAGDVRRQYYLTVVQDGAFVSMD